MCKCKSAYIGETTRHTKRQYYEHMGKSALTDKPLARKVPSAIGDHNSICNSNIKEQDFSILCRESNEYKLLVKETIFINMLKPKLNLQVGSMPVKLFKS